jgi:hypothetical protein
VTAAVRRAVVVLGLAVAVLAGTASPAGASFSGSSAATAAIATATVAPPGNVSTTGSSCADGYFYVRLSWTPSGARNVTGYAVTVYRADGSTSVIATTGSGTTSFANTYLRGYQTYRFTVTTRTSYGWTTESPRTAGLYC